MVAVSETDAAAEAEYGAHAEYFYHKLLHVPLPFLAAPGYMSIPSMRAMGYSMDLDRLKSLKWKNFVEDGYVVAGSPATVRDRLREILKTLRVGHLLLLLHFGSMPDDLTRKNMQLFAEEVMPALRGLWSEWPDEWWPSRSERSSG
jgi:alkanesulfonate monooxygenase SsuD/methylene tetrahydromethanopterin reductase-like flavin-dependent oxidoreductase (luciferase family)